ncbi:MAG: HAMP domain-containing sensor histidine kinase [Pseudomonadota bacterium]|nr:HAMP domain-containing sensor histidine kinase [Pseudomonadota bacterium]
MTQTRTIETFFRRALFKYAGLIFGSLVLILSATSFLLAREQAAASLQESARATAQAFKDRIIDGDIRSVEAQVRDLLLLKEHEVVKILRADHSKIYSQVGDRLEIAQCPSIGVPCFDGYFGPARIEFPISMDSANNTPFRYLYISRAISLNWSFLITVFLIFSIGYFALIIYFLRISKVASISLGSEIKNWSARIRENPKDAGPRHQVPFNELIPLKEALDGLTQQIENFERTATDKARLLLLRGIAHDLLTPVAQLQLNLATLETRLHSNDQNELLTDIRDSLKRVTGVASQVKSLNEKTAPENTELVSMVESEVKALSENESLTSKGIKVRFSSKSDSIRCPFSKTDISRILANLVQNASDASPNGSVINVRVSTENNIGTLSIEDFGKGISKMAQPNVFDPEFTLKPGTGTGLGLAVVKYICDKRLAKIELKSELNKGTNISIQFPILRGETCINY